MNKVIYNDLKILGAITISVCLYKPLIYSGLCAATAVKQINQISQLTIWLEWSTKLKINWSKDHSIYALHQLQLNFICTSSSLPLISPSPLTINIFLLLPGVCKVFMVCTCINHTNLIFWWMKHHGLKIQIILARMVWLLGISQTWTEELHWFQLP